MKTLEEKIEKNTRTIIGMGPETYAVSYDENVVRTHVEKFIKGLYDSLFGIDFSGESIQLIKESTDIIQGLEVTITKIREDKQKCEKITKENKVNCNITLHVDIFYQTFGFLNFANYILSAQDKSNYNGSVKMIINPLIQLDSVDLNAATPDDLCQIIFEKGKNNSAKADLSEFLIEAWIEKVGVIIRNRYTEMNMSVDQLMEQIAKENNFFGKSYQNYIGVKPEVILVYDDCWSVTLECEGNVCYFVGDESKEKEIIQKIENSGGEIWNEFKDTICGDSAIEVLQKLYITCKILRGMNWILTADIDRD